MILEDLQEEQIKLPNVGRMQKMHAGSGRMIAAVLKLISVSALMQPYSLCETSVQLGPGAINTSSDFLGGNWCVLL